MPESSIDNKRFIEADGQLATVDKRSVVSEIIEVIAQAAADGAGVITRPTRTTTICQDHICFFDQS
jgi:hypothetical protein